jgi:hypothetical protein
MKKTWMVWLVLAVFLAMAACAGMQKGGEKIHRARGTVDAYEPGKMIKLSDKMEVQGSEAGQGYFAKVPNPGEYTFAITPATEVIGTPKPGERALIRYTGSGTGKTAVSIEDIWKE